MLVDLVYFLHCQSWSSGNALVSGVGGLKFKSRAGQIGHSCQQLATAAIFFRKKLCCLGALTRNWASWPPQTRLTLQRNIASMMKDLADLIDSAMSVFEFGLFM